jgi:hypothetical protein
MKAEGLENEMDTLQITRYSAFLPSIVSHCEAVAQLRPKKKIHA